MLWARETPEKAKVAVVSFNSKNEQGMELVSVLKKELQKTNWVQVVDFEKSPDFVFFVRQARETLPKFDRIVFSVAVTQSLPAPVLDELAKQQISYKVLPAFNKKNLPKEGTFVREYVTREMWKEYRYLLDLKTYAFEKKETPAYLKQVAENGLTAISRVYRVQK